MTFPQGERIPEMLNFNPKWWWDPVPWWFATQLDKSLLKDLAVIQVELQKDILTLQLKSLDRTLAVIGKAGR